MKEYDDMSIREYIDNHASEEYRNIYNQLSRYARNTLANGWLDFSVPVSLEYLKDFLALDRGEITGDEIREKIFKKHSENQSY